MKKKSVGLILLTLSASLFVNFIFLFTLSGRQEKEQTLEKKVDTRLKEYHEENDRLNRFIETHTSALLEKQSEEKEHIKEALTLLYTYAPETKTSRFEKLTGKMSSQVLSLINPALDIKDGDHLTEEEFNPFGENVTATDQKETVSISDISLFTEGNGKYLAVYTLTFKFPTSESTKQTCLTSLSIEDDIITSWELSTTELQI